MDGQRDKAEFECAITEAVQAFAAGLRPLPAVALRAARAIATQEPPEAVEPPKWTEFHFDSSRRVRAG
jgi:hypothetical protein